jgi:hypothetical protein
VKEKMKCEIREKESEDQKSSDEHFMTVHELLIRALNPNEIEMNFKCCKCEKNCENLENLEKHVKLHEHNFQRFSCVFCSLEVRLFS